MATANTLTSPFFGIEMEMYLRPKTTEEVEKAIAEFGWDRTGSDPNRVRGHLHDLVRFVLGIEDFFVEADPDDSYSHWVLVGDPSLKEGEADGFWGAELVSRILHANEDWKTEVNDLFKALTKYCDVKVGRSYGTHVHVSPGDRPWTSTDLAAIHKAAALYNESIFDILPTDRKNNKHAVSNFTHERAPPSLRGAYSAALASGDYRGMFTFLDGLTSPSMFADLYESRRFMFNIKRLSTSPSETIEFRSAPPSGDAGTAIHWATWVLSFMVKATNTDWNATGGPMAPATRESGVAKLRRFILEGNALLPARSRGGIDPSRIRTVSGTSP